MRTDSETAKLNAAWSQQAIHELCQLGVRQICLSPGFRNSPLILAAQRNPQIDCVTCVDERVSAFFALGLAKKFGAPVALLSTSGTACANFFPAILEARYSHAPLIVVTADRPRRLLGLGSNQTMDQYNLYGNNVKTFTHLDAPSADRFDHLIYSLHKSLHSALNGGQGPVHINMCFEEPLLPGENTTISEASYKIPQQQALPLTVNPAPAAREVIRACLEKSQNPALLLGPGNFTQDFLTQILEISQRWEIPLFAEPCSGILATGRREKPSFLFTHFHLLSRGNLAGANGFDLLLRFGPPLIHRSVQKFIDDSPQLTSIIFDAPFEMRDPNLGNSFFVMGDLAESARILQEGLISENYQAKRKKNWAQLRNLEDEHHQLWQKKIADESALTELFIASRILDLLPDPCQLFLGNSMPIRDFNFVARFVQKNTRIFHNRGLSGIDGLISSAAGTAYRSKSPTLLLLGDLSAIHDIGSLASLHALGDKLDLTVMVLNNGGGEIFRTLTARNFPEEWFTTPHPVCFESLCAGFMIPYTKVSTKAEFLEILPQKIREPGTKWIEAVVDRPANSALRQ